MHNLDALTAALHEAGFQTNIETSGSSPLSGEWDWIYLSPKNSSSPSRRSSLFYELKVVIFNKIDFAWAEKYAAQVSPTCKLYLAPEWDKSKEMTPSSSNTLKKISMGALHPNT